MCVTHRPAVSFNTADRLHEDGFDPDRQNAELSDEERRQWLAGMMGLTPQMSADDARWADNPVSPDYRHLGVRGQSRAFTFTADHLVPA